MNRKIAYLVFGVLFLTPIVLMGSTNSNYIKGWNEFSKNNKVEARKYFELATQEEESKADAFLSLCLVDWSEEKEESALKNFQNFYEISPFPDPYLYGLYSAPFTMLKQILPNEQLKFYEKVFQNPNVNGTIKAMVAGELGEHYFNKNNPKKAQEFFNSIGALDKWQILGSFDNISGSGYDKNWGAVEKATTNEVFKNKANADVSWYSAPLSKENKWFYFDYAFILSDIIAYAQTFVESPSDQDVYLRAGTSGSLKVWINDTQIASIPEERNCDLDIYSYKIRLNKGYNRILVQIGQSAISAANFLIRLTDENANPLAGLTWTEQYQNYKKSTDKANNGLLPFFAEQYFENKIIKEPNNLLNYLLLGEVYLRNDKAYEGTHILKKAEELAPLCSFINYRLTEAYLRGGNQIDYSREVENIKKNDPNSFQALHLLYRDAVRSEKYLEAEGIYKQIVKLYGKNEKTDDIELELFTKQGKINDVIMLSKELFAKRPYKFEYMHLNYVIEKEIKKNQKSARKVLENYCKQYFHSQALAILADNYISAGELGKGLATYKKRMDYTPYTTGFKFSYATILQQMQRYNEALAVLEETKKIAPYLSQIYNTEGYIYKGMNDIAKAKESFNKSIYYGQTSYDSRRQLRLLDGKPEVFEVFPKVNLDGLINKPFTQREFPEDDAIMILVDEQLVFYPEGAQEHRTELAVKILNQTGVETWKEYSVYFNRNNQKLILDKYEIIKVNGQRIKANTNNDGLIVFTNIEVGDILHLEYRLQSYYSGVLSHHFYDYSLMQYSYPAQYIRSSILVPNNKAFQYRVTKNDIQPIVSEIEDMKMYQWISEEQLAIKYEPNMASIVDVAPVLVFSSVPEWEVISNWYKDLTVNKIDAHSDYVLKETMGEILKGKEDVSDLEKAELFYEYILNNITYSNVSFMQSNFIPQKASRTIVNRLGDCKDMSTLFVSLCRQAGINANLVLVNTRDNGQTPLLFPTNHFNHCVARLEIDGKIYYLELTDNKLPFATIPNYDSQSPTLPIPYKNESLGNQLLAMDIESKKKNDIIRNTQVSIVNNDMLINYNNKRHGQLASNFRYQYLDLGPEDRLKGVSELCSSDWNMPIKVTNLFFENLDNLSDSVINGYTLEIKGAIQDVAGMQIFKMPWSEAINSLHGFGHEERKYSYEFWKYIYCDLECEEIQVMIPTGKKWLETPKNVKLECKAATYELIFELEKSGELHATRIFTKKKDVVPAEEYEELREFIKAVSENDNKQYAIK